MRLPPRQVKRHIPLVAVGFLFLFCLPAKGFQRPREEPLPPLPVTRLDDRPRIADLDLGNAVSLSIADPIPVKEALLLLVKGTAFSLVLGEQVEGTFSGELKDLSPRQAIEAVLRPKGLDYTVEGNLISVHRRKTTSRLFDVSYLNVRRETRREIRGSAGFSSSINSSYFDEIERAVASMLSADGRAHVDRRNGVVHVSDFQERIDRISNYLETVQSRAVRQVRLSARLVEVTLSDPDAHAVDWKAVAARSGEPWGATFGGAGVRVQDFSAVLKALASQGAVRTLASPQVVAMNNEPAVMHAGTATDGFTMTVTPHIDPGGMVILSVSPTYSEKTDIAEADTVVRIRDGESILVAGLLQRKDAVSTELVILLNATIVTPGPVALTGIR